MIDTLRIIYPGDAGAEHVAHWRPECDADAPLDYIADRLRAVGIDVELVDGRDAWPGLWRRPGEDAGVEVAGAEIELARGEWGGKLQA